MINLSEEAKEKEKEDEDYMKSHSIKTSVVEDHKKKDNLRSLVIMIQLIILRKILIILIYKIRN